MRVERSFMCRKDDVARYKNILRVNEPMPLDDGAPAIDGLYIFPEPQEQVRDDGFVEFRVTAYGRSLVQEQVTRGAVYVILQATDRVFNSETGETTTTTTPVPALCETFTIRRVLSASENLENIIPPPAGIQPNVFLFGSTYIPSPVFFLRQFSSTNFGIWTEWTYTYESWTSLGSFTIFGGE